MTSQTTNVDQFQALPYGDTLVRVCTDNGAPWFVLPDVCSVLGIRNSRDAAASLDDDEKDGVGLTDTIGRSQETTLINESGLYSLIMRSRKPAAKQFKKWVTSEVLPSIRKTGSYTTQQTQAEPAPLSNDECSFQSTGLAPVGLLCDAIRDRMIRCEEAGAILHVEYPMLHRALSDSPTKNQTMARALLEAFAAVVRLSDIRPLDRFDLRWWGCEMVSNATMTGAAAAYALSQTMDMCGRRKWAWIGGWIPEIDRLIAEHWVTPGLTLVTIKKSLKVTANHLQTEVSKLMRHPTAVPANTHQ